MKPTSQHIAVTAEAAEWYQLLEQGELDEASRLRFREWLREPANLEELARICWVDAQLHRAFEQSARELPKNVIDFGSYAPMIRSRPRPPQRRAVNWRMIFRKVVLAASFVVAVIVLTWKGVGSWDNVIVTRQGQWDKQLLHDGTVVYVGPDTELHFHFTDETRAVKLDRGRALFEVAKDPSRPLIVSTNYGTVRAVGTAFATVDLGDTVLVTVAEGKVAVSAAALRDGVQPMAYATANQQVVLSPTGVSVPTAVDADHEHMWIRNWYEYEGDPVAEIVARLNELNPEQVIVDDPQVLRLRLKGLMFKPSQPEQFVRAVNLWYAGYPKKAASTALHLEWP
jgi:transmembrane sensor